MKYPTIIFAALLLAATGSLAEEKSSDGVAPAGSFNINQGLTGAWFDAATAGQGFLIEVDPDAEFLFLAWFTFEQAGGKVGATDQRWLTAQGNYSGDTASLTAFTTSGGVFDDPQGTMTVEAGTISIQFSSCSNATLSYDLPDNGLQGSIDLTRVIPGTEVLCQQL